MIALSLSLLALADPEWGFRGGCHTAYVAVTQPVLQSLSHMEPGTAADIITMLSHNIMVCRVLRRVMHEMVPGSQVIWYDPFLPSAFS